MTAIVTILSEQSAQCMFERTKINGGNLTKFFSAGVDVLSHLVRISTLLTYKSLLVRCQIVSIVVTESSLGIATLLIIQPMGFDKT